MPLLLGFFFCFSLLSSLKLREKLNRSNNSDSESEIDIPPPGDETPFPYEGSSASEEEGDEDHIGGLLVSHVTANHSAHFDPKQIGYDPAKREGQDNFKDIRNRSRTDIFFLILPLSLCRS
jgi:hypothetical protein